MDDMLIGSIIMWTLKIIGIMFFGTLLHYGLIADKLKKGEQ